jgi:transcriptional regulator with XRE-family HTH domain
MDIRNKLKQLMDDNNVSMYRLAKEIGVHQSTIKNWIDGSTIPKIDRIGQIADFFDIPVADLIEHEDTSAMAPYEALSQLYSNIDRLCSASGYSIPQLEAELGYGGETIKKMGGKTANCRQDN